MKCSKATGPSSILAEMLKAAGEEEVELVRQLTEAVFSCGMIPSNWEESFILDLYKGNGEILDRRVVWSSQVKPWSCWNEY